MPKANKHAVDSMILTGMETTVLAHQQAACLYHGEQLTNLLYRPADNNQRRNTMSDSKDHIIRISELSATIGHQDKRALRLLYSAAPETLTEDERGQQANRLIDGVRLTLAHHPGMALIGTEEQMVAFAKQTGGFGNIWVKDRALSNNYWHTLHNVCVALKAQGYTAAVEGGGAAPGFLFVTLADGRMVAFGDNNETWGGEIYADEAAVESGDVGDSLDAGVDHDVTDPNVIVAAFIATYGR